MITLAALNALDQAAFTDLLSGIFEHSPWVPQAVWPARPFASKAALHDAMVAVVAGAGDERQLALLRAHPELARPAALTAASAAEQGGMGLDRLDAEEAAAFDAANAAYRERFGFPFIIAVRGQRDRTAILAALNTRLGHSVEQERQAALAEVAKIAGFRLSDLIDAGYLTVHVLDTATGQPAAGLSLTLFRVTTALRAPLGTFVTNADGRCDSPLQAGPAFTAGTYEVVFHVAAWRGNAADAGFYDLIPIRFVVTDPAVHIHIPLLLSPYGYMTYRGS